MRDLIERLEKEGASYALDVAIAQRLVPEIIVGRQRNDDSGFDPHTYRCFTTKIDDVAWLAEVILPEWTWTLDSGAPVATFWKNSKASDATYQVAGHTPALALLIALLRAKEDQNA